MGPYNPFEFSTDALDGGAGMLVARVRMKADAEDVPRFEGMRQHEQLRFGVRRGPDGGAREPCVTNLTNVEHVPPSLGMILRPRPFLQVPEAR
jgi:hypothetical protein